MLGLTESWREEEQSSELPNLVTSRTSSGEAAMHKKELSAVVNDGQIFSERNKLGSELNYQLPHLRPHRNQYSTSILPVSFQKNPNDLGL